MLDLCLPKLPRWTVLLVWVGTLWSPSYLIILRWWYAGFLPYLIDSTLPMTICQCQTGRHPLASPLGALKCVLNDSTYSNLSGTTLVWLCLHTGAITWSIYWTSRVRHPSTYQITCGRVVAGTHWTCINAEPGRGRITSIVFLKFWFEAILHKQVVWILCCVCTWDDFKNYAKSIHCAWFVHQDKANWKLIVVCVDMTWPITGWPPCPLVPGGCLAPGLGKSAVLPSPGAWPLELVISDLVSLSPWTSFQHDTLSTHPLSL